jgi:hypothetical protein
MPEQLRISRLELNEQDPNAKSFNLHLSRPISQLEREALRALLSKAGFYAPFTEAPHPTVIAVDNVEISAFEHRREDIKAWVVEAESTAKLQQEYIDTQQAAAVAKIQDSKTRAAAIDWT